MRRLVAAGFPTVFLLLALACGGSDPEETGDGPGPEQFGSDESGVDVSSYAVRTTAGPAGGRVALPDGTTLAIPDGELTGDVDVGLREAAKPPRVGTDAEPLSSWYEAGLSNVDVTVDADSPVEIAVPIRPDALQIGHPGLVLWVHVSEDVQFPLNGRYDDVDGVFVARIAALPSRFRFAVVFNPHIVRLDAADAEPPVLWASPRLSPGAGGWGTTDWVIDYDGRAITAAQATKVLGAARQASIAYSYAGFREPILLKTAEPKGERWHIHLIATGSKFQGNAAATDHGVVQLSGNLYVSTACIDIPVDSSAASVYAQVAHELFHAVFFAYRIPFILYNYTDGGVTYGYRSSSGYNEGMATAIGTYVEQGHAFPRPSIPAFDFGFPLGFFDANRRGLAYRNQDFFVFLLRVGSLGNIRQMLESLAASGAPTGSNLDNAATYGQAVEAGGIGVSDANGSMSFNDFLSEYMANRGFVRSGEGWIWPSEPSGGTPGAGYRLDRTLFGGNTLEVDEDDCEVDGLQATCEVEFPDALPMTGLLVDMDLGSLGEAFEFKPTVVQASATVASGRVSYWLFGESGGAGHSGFLGRAANGSSVSLVGFEEQLTDLRMILTNGGARGPVWITLEFAGEPDDELGPECRILADCCPNLPTQAVIGQCEDIVAGRDERDCAIGQASLLRLCRD
jgi:hypothetical protein